MCSRPPFRGARNGRRSSRFLFRAYVAAKQDQQALDYDDLLLYWAEMMSDPGIAADGRASTMCWSTSTRTPIASQSAILLAMKPDGRGLTVVGDDAQSIYSSARPPCATSGLSHAVSKPARVVTLDRNYRSTQPILNASNAVIGLAAERYAKDLWTDRQSPQLPEMVNVSDEAGQARAVADQVLAQREAGATLSQAALFRSASHSAALELELTRRIPFVKFGGLRFLEAAHIKDPAVPARWAENPRGRMAGFRAQLLPGVGPATAGKLMDAMSASAEPLAALRAFKPGAAAQQDWAPSPTPSRAARSRAEMARRRGPGLALVCGPASNGMTTACAAPTWNSWPASRRLSVARTLPDRADARSSRRHQRRPRACATRTT